MRSRFRLRRDGEVPLLLLPLLLLLLLERVEQPCSAAVAVAGDGAELLTRAGEELGSLSLMTEERTLVDRSQMGDEASQRSGGGREDRTAESRSEGHFSESRKK